MALTRNSCQKCIHSLLFTFFYSSFACSSSSEPHRKIIKIDKKTGRKEGGEKNKKERKNEMLNERKEKN